MSARTPAMRLATMAGQASVSSSLNKPSFRSTSERSRAGAAPMRSSDPPPLKWSALSYGFRAEEDHDAEEETQARGDRCEAAPSGRAGVPRSERCRRGSFDWRDGGDLLPLAPGVWRAQGRSGLRTRGCAERLRLTLDKLILQEAARGNF